jgi:hypothetical protein
MPALQQQSTDARAEQQHRDAPSSQHRGAGVGQRPALRWRSLRGRGTVNAFDGVVVVVGSTGVVVGGSVVVGPVVVTVPAGMVEE